MYSELGLQFDGFRHIYDCPFFIVGDESRQSILDLLNSTKISLFLFLYLKEEPNNKIEMLLDFIDSGVKSKIPGLDEVDDEYIESKYDMDELYDENRETIHTIFGILFS